MAKKAGPKLHGEDSRHPSKNREVQSQAGSIKRGKKTGLGAPVRKKQRVGSFPVQCEHDAVQRREAQGAESSFKTINTPKSD